jgi:formylglycine-generating enzyme required for sulfatase activity
MEFVWIPPGTFWMGSPEDEPERDDDEKRHQVTLTRGYWLQTTPVTQRQYEAVTGENPSNFKKAGPDAPVERVSWEDAQAFVAKLNELEGRPIYRLPTEAEWEYACRAETETAYSWGNEPDCGRANYGAGPLFDECKDRNPGRTTPVGEYPPNPRGLYDMHGNVFEWCSDWFEAEYSDGPLIDPVGPDSGEYRVIRGGSWGGIARNCRAAFRGNRLPGGRNDVVGFRLLREAP